MIDINKIDILYFVNESDYGNEILRLKVDHVENILTSNDKGEDVIHKGIIGVFTNDNGFKVKSYVDDNLYNKDIFYEEKDAKNKLIEINK